MNLWFHGSKKLFVIAVLLAYFIYGLCKNWARVLGRILVWIFLFDIIILQFFPQLFLFQPVDFIIQVTKTFTLIFPRVIVVIFIETDVLLPAVGTIIHNCKIAAVNDARGNDVDLLDGKYSRGVFTILIPIARSNTINCVTDYSTYFFWLEILVIVVDLKLISKSNPILDFAS